MPKREPCSILAIRPKNGGSLSSYTIHSRWFRYSLPLLMAPPDPMAPADPEDAGAKFVLESKGNWAHAGYHLTAATAGPPLLALPFAMAGLGWGPGILALFVGGALSFYGCYLLSLVMEEVEIQGKRCLRYRDLARHVIGPKWTSFFVAPLQFLICFMVVVSLIVLGGQSMQGIYAKTSPNGDLKLYHFVTIFGAATLLLSQLPSFHSLRYVNLLSMLLCLGFSLCALIGSVISGSSSRAPPKDYSVQGSSVHVLFGAFNSISIMVTAYANPLIVEIQATLAPPATGKMVKGLMVCYAVAISTFFSVAISGYWAFGNASEGIIFMNMETLAPEWIYILGYSFACLQLIMASVLYLQPLFEKYEGIVADVNSRMCSLRNVVPRLLGRSLFVAVAVLLAAMLPYFADFNALMGAFGFVPLCITLPLVLYSLVFRNTGKALPFISCVNIVIAGLSLIVVILGTIAAVHQIALDVNTYTLFPNT